MEKEAEEQLGYLDKREGCRGIKIIADKSFGLKIFNVEKPEF